MNERMRLFCYHYIKSGNATESAKEAGYSERTAHAKGHNLLLKPEIKAFIEKITHEADAGKIADSIEILERLTAILRDENAKDADKIKAALLLLKAVGLPQEEKEIIVPAEEEAEEGTKICFPKLERDTYFNAVQMQNGRIVPLAGTESADTLIYLPYTAVYEEEEEE